MTFEEGLEKFREREQPEDVICLVGKTDDAQNLRLICAAWGKTRPERKDDPTPPPENENNLWDWLWDQVEIDHDDLRRKTGVGGTQAKVDILRGNRIIYPDGTITTFATKILRQYMKAQLGI